MTRPSITIGALVSFSCLLGYATPAHSQWAIQTGASYNIQSGSFRAPCGCMFHTGSGIWSGKGIGLRGAVSYDILSLNEFTIGIEPGFDLKAVTDYEVPGDPSSGDQINIQMRYITFGPYVRYQIHGSGLLFQFAPEADYLLSNSYQHISRPISDPAQDKDSSMGDLRAIRYAALISVGYKFEVFGMELAPVLTADLPLNNIRMDASLNPATDIHIHGASGWHITSLDLSLAVFFKL